MARLSFLFPALAGFFFYYYYFCGNILPTVYYTNILPRVYLQETAAVHKYTAVI